MKRILILILAGCAFLGASDSFADRKPPKGKPAPGVNRKVPPPPGLHHNKRAPAKPHKAPPPKHHHKKSSSSSFWGGVVGGVIGSALFGPPAPPQPIGHYEIRNQQVWVEGAWVYMTDAFGVQQRVWQPGHYEVRPVEVWVTP